MRVEYHPTTLPHMEDVYTVVRDRGMSTFQTLCALSDNPSNPTYLSLGHFHWWTTHLLPTIDKTNVSFNIFSGGKLTNNRYSSYGSANQLITSNPLFIKAICWDTGLSTTRPLCALSSGPLNSTFNSWTILIGNHCPITFCLHLSHATDPRWQFTNNF